MVDSKRFCNLSFQVLDIDANYSKNEITPCHQEWFHANLLSFFDSPLITIMNMSFNLTSLTDIFFDFKDGMILIA
jgi:hypothetical protein